MKKILWQERVKETEKFHKNLLAKNGAHQIALTAKMLGRSFGSIAEDLMVASWMETHPRISEFEFMKDAIDFIREKKLEIKLRRRN